MKAVFQNVFKNIIHSSIRGYRLKPFFFDSPWHYHPEYEIVLILQGTGTRFVGDHVDSFGPGDFVFLGPNIPHAWLSDEIHMKEEVFSECVVIQFKPGIVPQELLLAPEFINIKHILDKSRKGIKINFDRESSLAKYVLSMPLLEDIEKVSALYMILDEISRNAGFKEILTDNYDFSHDIKEDRRIQKVTQFVLDNYMNIIKIEDAARKAGMNHSSFCRYFKKMMHKTFMEYVIEIRLLAATRLLIHHHYNISQVCFETGFQNLSNFNRLFKVKYNMTPKEYRKKYQEKIKLNL